MYENCCFYTSVGRVCSSCGYANRNVREMFIRMVFFIRVRKSYIFGIDKRRNR